MPCGMTAIHYIQRTTTLDPRRCDYSIEKAPDKLEAHWYTSIFSFNVLTRWRFKKKLLFASLAAFKQPQYFRLMRG